MRWVKTEIFSLNSTAVRFDSVHHAPDATAPRWSRNGAGWRLAAAEAQLRLPMNDVSLA